MGFNSYKLALLSYNNKPYFTKKNKNYICLNIILKLFLYRVLNFT